MLNNLIHSSLFLSLLLLFSCNSEGNKQNSGTDKAYQDYQNFVTEFEQDTISKVEFRAMASEDDSASWVELKQEREQQYAQLRQGVDQNIEENDQERRQEIKNLEQRYDKAVKKQEEQYQDVSHRYKLRQQLLGIEVKEDDLSDITPENIATSYKRFVANVEDYAKAYDTRDWDLIEGWWSSLNNRYSTLQDQLKQQEKTQIDQAQNRYKELRQQYVVR